MRKRTLALLLALAMLLTFALSGCGGNETSSTASGGNTSTSTPADTGDESSTAETSETGEEGGETTGTPAAGDAMTQVNTPRAETLIVDGCAVRRPQAPG